MEKSVRASCDQFVLVLLLLVEKVLQVSLTNDSMY